jgi:hypothetical protein
VSFQDYERGQLKKVSDKVGGLVTTLRATATWDPAATAATQGAAVTTTVPVPGAAVGDAVHVAFSQVIPDNAILTGHVSAADTVTVKLANLTAAAVNLASGTVKVIVFK